ncbi:MAG: rhodanese-like domain-containing protein [Nitrososphaerota archaeon]|nr:rhodanese-like domain-containing protein [Nitrososphaerota archaeon]
MLTQALPISTFGAEIQEPVTKNGAKYTDVITSVVSNSNLGDKIAANGAKYDIELDGKIVGSLIFNKNDPYIEIILTSDVAVDVLWNCASKYADCTLKGTGTYKVPQLVQDNGKTQSFNAIWITNVEQNLSGNYQNVSVQDAKQLIDSTNAIIIDVRNQSEYDLGHLYNAQLIPLYALENHTTPKRMEPPSTNDAFAFNVYNAMLNSFDLSSHINDPIVVYCKAGSRSVPACELLIKQGYTQVYNVVGGITEWMRADYPTYSPVHHVNVEVVDGKTTTDIEPWLLYTADCLPCQDLLENGSTGTSQLNFNDTIIQQSEDYTLTQSTIEIAGTIIEMLTERTIVWQQTENEPNFNRTMSLSSTISTSQDKMAQFYALSVQVQHIDYSITINTILSSLDESTYNQSTTFMEYIPAGSKPITTVETIEFTTVVTLSQLFQSLADTADDLGYAYEISKDDSLTVFAERYYTLADEAQLLAHTIGTQLASYDKPILFNSAIIEDGFWSDACNVACVALVGISCLVACVFSAGIMCHVCSMYTLDIIDGCSVLCAGVALEEDYGILAGLTPPRWINSVHSATWNGSAACYVTNENNICYPYSDGNCAQIYAGNYWDQAVIVGVLNNYAKGDIWLHGYSRIGYDTDYQIWVSVDCVNWGSSPLYTGTLYGSTATTRNFYGGYTSSNFGYIAIVCYDTHNSCNLFVDCVAVTS